MKQSTCAAPDLEDLPIQGKKIYLPTNRDDIIPKALDIVRDLDIDNLIIDTPDTAKKLDLFLKPFQINAIKGFLKFFKELDMKGVYNCYDPGLGKTIIAIVLFANILKAKRILVVCPSGLRGNWEDEIRIWDDDPDPVTVHTIYSSRGMLRPSGITAKWCVVSYRLLLKENVFMKLYEKPWDAVIFDEAKELKSRRSLQTKACMHLWNRTRRGMWMDGTPVTRSAQDLYVPCSTMMPGHFGSEDDFCEEYCLKRTVPWGMGWEYFHGQNLDKLSEIIRSNFFLRKTKEEVLPDLPDVTYQKIVLDCGSFDKKLTEEQEKAILEAVRLGKDPNECARPQDKKHISERRLEAGLKTIQKGGSEFIGNLLDGNIPVMVVAYHRDVINALMHIFRKFNPVKIDGSVVGRAKDLARDKFNNGQTNLLVIQIKSAVGINLQKRCCTAVYVETSYDPMQVKQSLDRIRRMGQKNAMNAYFFVAKGSVDEECFKVLKKKLEMIDQVVRSTDE